MHDFLLRDQVLKSDVINLLSQAKEKLGHVANAYVAFFLFYT